MRFQFPFTKTSVAAVVLFCLATTTNGQLSGSKTTVTLSEPMRTTYYPEIICPHCIIPHWDRDHLFRLEIDKDPALVSMFDRDGKKVLEADFKPSDAVSASVAATGSAHSGGILAAGGLTVKDGSLRQFIAETDNAGHVVRLITSKGTFYSRRVCETPDGSLWILGYDWDSRNSPDADKNILRRFDNKGPARSFISLDSIGNPRESISQITTGRSYLHCGTDHVSLYLGPSALYFEVHVSSGRVSRWNVDMSSVVGSKADGFAATDDGRIFVALSNASETGSERKRGLYELTAPASSATATLTLVQGTIAVFPSSQLAPDGTLLRLWGADGNDLVVTTTGDNWGLSWRKVLVGDN